MAFVFLSDARADAEAGIVIQDGDTVTTYCVAFTGDGITGDQLLKAAGQTFDAYGGGSGLAVCSVSGRGCEDASSFSSCFCQCQSGTCTYWAFFTRSYGKNWVYSSLAFNLLKAKDGDVHGWKWGQGGVNSAPAPKDVTFEQICGHAPQGGASTPTSIPATATLRPTLQATASATTGAATASAQTAEPPTQPVSQPVTVAPATWSTTPLVTLTGVASNATVGTPEITPTTNSEDKNGDSSVATLIAFGVVALALVAAIGAAVVWRSKRA